MASVISPKDINKTSLPSLPQSLFLTPITEQEIIMQLNILNPNKSSAVNDIPIKFIKFSTSVIAPILTSLYNSCLTEGNFPQVLIVGLITRIYKKGNKKTLLSTFSKILEKCIYFRLSSFLSDHHLITGSQYGFRPGVSTSDAISDLHNEILSHLDQKNNVCCTFLDLANAFDTVDHSDLLKKLSCYGIRVIALQLIESFLDNRKQCTVVKNVCSLSQNVTCSVPQGSTLDPLLFIIYINDLVQSKNFKVNLFADDIVLVMSHKSTEKLQNQVIYEMNLVGKWMNANKLTINYSKSNFMLFTNKKKKKQI